jgi:hypothetical protein
MIPREEHVGAKQELDAIEQMFKDYRKTPEEVIRAAFYWLNEPKDPTVKRTVDPNIVQHAIKRYRRRREIPLCVPAYIDHYRQQQAAA